MHVLQYQIAFQRPAHQSCSLWLSSCGGWLRASRGKETGAAALGMRPGSRSVKVVLVPLCPEATEWRCTLEGRKRSRLCSS